MVYGWERSKKMNANVIFTTNMISANLNMLARARKQRRQLLEMGYGIEVPKIMEKKFEGSIPAFIAAFARSRKLSDKEIDEIRQIIEQGGKGYGCFFS